MERESLMRLCESAMQEFHASVCRIHKHEEETRAPLMRVTSEVRLDQAMWSSNARTLRVVMKETSEMRLWNKLVSHARAWDRFHCPYLDSTDAAGQKSML